MNNQASFSRMAETPNKPGKMTKTLKSKSPIQIIWDTLSGVGLATILITLLGIQTWLATLEMVPAGLLATLKKYFHWTSFFILAELKTPLFEKPLIIPMPSGFWVLALLLVNLTLGGLIRIRKTPKKIGVIMAHLGIVFMIAAGGVAQLSEKRGVMSLAEGEEADFAISLTDPSIEIVEIKDGKPIGDVYQTSEKELRWLGRNSTRTIRFAEVPFDVQISGWFGNTMVVREGQGSGHPAVNGWTLKERELDKQGELNSPGCYARVLHEDGSVSDPFILAVPAQETRLYSYAPQMVEAGGKTYALRLVKETIATPCTVRLEDAIAEYYPNTNRPKSFMSKVEYTQAGNWVPVDIEMNMPLRHNDFTFYQRTMMSGRPAEGETDSTGLEVVTNPADQWPAWGLWIVTIGLGIHFIYMLAKFVLNSNRKKITQDS